MIFNNSKNKKDITICIAVDMKGYSKKPENKEIGGIRNRLNGCSSHKKLTVNELAKAIENGQTIQGALLSDPKDNENTDDRFIKQQIFVIDIDNDIKNKNDNKKYKTKDSLDTPEDILQICKKANIKPCIISESFSSGIVDPNGNKINKFHVFFITESVVSDVITARKVLLALQKIFSEHADKACKDPARLIFGTEKSKNIWIYNDLLSIEKLLSPAHAENRLFPIKSQKTQYSNDRTEETDPNILLEMVDVNKLNYDEWLRVSASYKLYPSSSIDIWQSWNQQYKNNNHTANEKTYKSLTSKDVTEGSLKHFAKTHSPEAYQNYIDSLNSKKRTKPFINTESKFSAILPDNELLEMIINADNMTNEKIKAIKRMLISTNPYDADGTGRLNPNNLAKYLSDKGITVRYDDIKHDLSITGFKDNDIYSKEQLIPAIRFELEKYLKLCTPERLASSITNIAMDNHYNPILELIDSAEYDGKDHLQTAYEVLGIEDSQKYDNIRRANNNISREILKTWLKQAYCMLHNGFCGELFAADFALVLQGRQGKGKTSFFRKIALKSEYFGEGMSLNPDNKDSIIQGLTNFILELGEIESTFKRDISKVKALITNREDTYRLPYGQNYMKYPRLTTMCGTVNSAEFLIDDTGNRRFGVIPIDDSHDIMKHLDRLNVLQLWAQIREEVNADLARGKTYANCFRDRDLQTAINARNANYQKPITGELEIREILEEESAPTTDNRYKNEDVYMSASQFKEVHNEKIGKLSLIQIRAVFERLGIQKVTTIKKTYDKTPLKNTYKVPYKHLI